MASSDATLQRLGAAVRRAAEAYDRPDLATEVERTGAKQPARVVVAGDFKRGKSSLVNALLNAEVCSTAEAGRTEIPTVVTFSAEQTISVVRRGEEGETRSPVGADRLADLQNGAEPDVSRIEVGIPRRLLELGLELVDCPAAGSEGHAGRTATIAAARDASAVLLVTDASQPVTADEVSLARALGDVCGTVIVVSSKIDLAPTWRRTLEHDRAALSVAGVAAPVIPVSTAIRQAALRLGDNDLNVESGYVNLVDVLRERVVERGSRLGAERDARRLLRVVSALEGGLLGELESLTDAESARAAHTRLEAARREAEGLRASSARWQRALAEGAVDVQTEVDHRLGERVRKLLRGVEESLEEIDPGKQWDTFEPSLRDALSGLVDTTFADVEEQMAGLAERVIDAFAGAELDVAAVLSSADRSVIGVDQVDVADRLKKSRMAVLKDGITGLRSSYSGLLMFGMLASMLGFALLNPVTVTLGVALGGKSVFDERTRGAGTRRQQAMGAVRQHVDGVVASLRKELRLAIRSSQREIRAALSEQARLLAAAADEALTKARAASQSDATSRAQRTADLRAEIARLREMRRRIDATIESDGAR